MNILEKDHYQVLEDAYLEHKSLIVAFDFDNTVYDFHKVGLDCTPIIELLKDCDHLRFDLICFTSNSGDRLKFIEGYVREVLGIRGVKSLTFNDNADEIKGVMRTSLDHIDEYLLHNYAKIFDRSNTKPYFNILLDDKAGLIESYNNLRKLINKIKNKEI